jgi:hypothetical protein
MFGSTATSATSATTASTLAASLVANCIVVMSSPRIPSAERSLGEKKVSGARIDEARLIVFDDQLLRELGSLKTKWRRTLAKYGQPLKAFNANMVPVERWEQCLGELTTIKGEWGTAVNTAVAGLAHSSDALCAKYPHQEDSIRAQVPSESSFRASCQLLFTALKIRAEDVMTQESFLEELDGMEFSVLEEIAKMVIDSKRDKSAKPDKSGVDYLELLTKKVKSFGFVGQKVARVALQMEQALSQLRGADKLNVAQQNLLSTVFKRLTDTDFLLAHGLQVQSDIAAVQALQTTAAKAPAPAAKVQQAAAPAVRPTAKAPAPAPVRQPPMPPVMPPASGAWMNNPTCL